MVLKKATGPEWSHHRYTLSVNKGLIPNLIAVKTTPKNAGLINQSGIFWSVPMVIFHIAHFGPHK